MGKFGSAGKKVLIMLLRGYQYGVSPFLGNHCRFEPSCSRYTEEAIREWGVLKGGWLMIKRLLRCHPGCEGGFDPVPCILNAKTINQNNSKGASL